MKYKALLGFVGALALNAGALAESANLSLKWMPGTVYKHSTTQDMNMTMPMGGNNMVMTNSMLMNMKNTASEHAKGIAVKTKYTRVKMNMMMGGNPMMQYDSDNGGGNGMVDQAMKPLLDSEITTIYDKSGQIVGIEGLDKMQLNEAAGLTKESLEQMAKQSSQMLPNKEVKVGETWKSKMDMPMGKEMGEMKISFDMKLDSITGKIAKVSFTGNMVADIGEAGAMMKLEAKEVKGNYQFDTDMGQITEMRMDMDFNMTVAEGGGMKMEAKTTTTMKLTGTEKAK